MPYTNTLTRMSFEEALTPVAMRVTRLIQLGLMAGVLLYAFAVVAVYMQDPTALAGVEEVETVQMMTIPHLAFLLVAFVGGQFLSRRMFSPETLSKSPLQDDPRAWAEQCVMVQRSAIIVRLATLEGAAFFGLAVCMVSATNGTLRTFPLYWINLISAGVLLLYGTSTFPTKERLVGWFEERFNVQSIGDAGAASMS
jgi:Na+/H+ antiporter NhaD/arsenite permease-like protein